MFITINIHSKNLNNTRCDNLGKLMKQTSQGKNLGGTIPREQPALSN